MMRKREGGQILLLVVLVISAVLGIAGAIFFESLTQQQISKLQEESARALATAESLAEKALSEGTTVSLQQGEETGSETFFGEAKIVTTSESDFVTPLLFKDEQYVVYLANLASSSAEIQQKLRDLVTGSDTISQATDYSLSLQLENKSDFGGASCPQDYAFEIGLLDLTKINTNPIKYKIIDCSEIVSGSEGEISMGQTFNTEGAHLMFIRVLATSNASNVGVKLKIVSNSGNLPLQGTTVKSTVRSVSGVTESLTLFQSYPQLSASLFVTAAGSPQ